MAIHNKIFKNDDAVASLLIFLIFALLFSTTAMTYFMHEIYGINVIAPELNTKDLHIQYSSKQNFASGDYDLSTMGIAMYSKWVNVSGVGMVLTTSGRGVHPYFLVKNILPDSEGLYQNTYVVNNSPTDIFGRHGDYCIVLRYTSGTDQNEVCINSEGFSIPDYIFNAGIRWGNSYYVPYPDANQIQNPIIKTVYNDKTPSLIMYFNDEKIIETTQLHKQGSNFMSAPVYYAGVASDNLGFTFESFQTEGLIISGVSGETTLESISGFLITTWKIATFTLPPEIPFPTELSFLFDIMVFGIFVCIIIIWRG
jgi:hypothetical protein